MLSLIPKCRGRFNYHFVEGGEYKDVKYFMEHDFPRTKKGHELKPVRCKRCGELSRQEKYGKNKDQ